MNPPKALKSKRFEQKPKRVIRADDFKDHLGVMRHARLRTQLNEILDCIHNGAAIPEEYYPRNIDRQGDRLLTELGVKHLHLDGQGSDIIVYLAEFASWVELIEINTHVHLESEPRGRDLKGRFMLAGAAVGAVAGAATAELVVKKRKRKPQRKPRY